jgi:hypothetical protein
MAEEIKLVLSADDEGLQAAFGRARAAVGSYEKRVEASRQAALRAALGQEEVLRLQAGGHVKQARALEQEIALHDRARKLAQEAGITEQKAIAILERRAALQRQIAATQNAPGRPLEMTGGFNISPQTMQAMERTAFLQQNLRREALAAGQAGRNGAMGFLAFSQAVEDAQYGIRGVLNNIPQMVMGFGGSMGLAGAISLAAVAAASLYPLLKRLYGRAETERLTKAAEAWTKAFEGGAARAAALGAEVRLAGEIAVFATQARQAMDERLRLQDGMMRALEQEVAARERARVLADEVTAAERRMLQARGEKGNGADEARRAETLRRLEEDARTQGEMQERASAEAARLREAAANVRAESADGIAAREKELARLRENLAGAEANAAAAQAELDGGAKGFDAGNARVNLGKAQAMRKELEAAILRLEGERDALRALQESAEASTREQIRQLDERINRHFREAKALEEKRRQTERLHEIEKEMERNAEARAKRDAVRKGSDKGLDVAREAVEKEVAAAEERARRDRSRASFAGEMMALQLEARGRKEQADALRKELEMRAGAKDLAKELGVTEERALALLREKERLAREIANQNERAEGATRRGGIRRAAGDKIQAGGGRIESRGRGAFLGDDLGRSPGLRNAVLESRGKERAASARPADKAAGLMARQNELTERMVKIFEGLGAY